MAVGEHYADIEDGIWYVFHSENGHASSSWSDQATAEREARIMNRRDPDNTRPYRKAVE